MNKPVLAIAFLVSASFGCTLGGPPPISTVPGRLCVPGEETDPGSCDPSCPSDATHMICNMDGSGSRCVLRDGHTCDSTPPAPCGGDDRLGTACGCMSSGIWYCAGDVVTCSASPSEICGDHVDNDCDGQADEGCTASCTPTTEICDGRDNDCNGNTDEGCDDDHDNYCDSGMTVAAGCSCTGSPPGIGNDCNDTNAAVHPGATEVCNGIDDNCNSLVDAAEPGVTCGSTCGRGHLIGSQICVEWTGSTTPMTTYGGTTIVSPDVMIFGCSGERSVAAGSSDCVPLTEACQGWLATTASQGSFDAINNVASFYRPSGGDLRGLNATDLGVRVTYVDATGTHALPGNKSWVAFDPNHPAGPTTPVTVPSYASSHVGERIIRLMVPVREDCLVDGMRPPDLY